jgi:hypothetical protein
MSAETPTSLVGGVLVGDPARMPTLNTNKGGVSSHKGDDTFELIDSHRPL